MVERDPRLRGDKPFPKTGVHPRLRKGTCALVFLSLGGRFVGNKALSLQFFPARATPLSSALARALPSCFWDRTGKIQPRAHARENETPESGLNMITARLSPGAISESNSSHLPPSEASPRSAKPVMFPVGRSGRTTMR